MSFSFSTKKNNVIPVIYLEHTDNASVNYIKQKLNLSCNVLTRNRDVRKTTYCLYISSKMDLHNVLEFLNELENQGQSFKGYKLIQFKE